MKKETNQKKYELGRMDIIDIYGWYKTKKIKTGPYFQRFSVWKEKDKVDFIDTIMSGYPIPSVFFCDGEIDLEKYTNTYWILDGRQRLESIFEFIEDKFEYKSKKFKEFSEEEKKIFFNYSIPVNQIYLQGSNEEKDIQIKEIFKRLNKNSYNLNKIEIQMSQYSKYSFIKICKVVCGYIDIDKKELESYKKELEDLKNLEETEEIYLDDSQFEEELKLDDKVLLYEYFQNIHITNIQKLFTDNKIFTDFQRKRQINLQHFLNLIGTLKEGWFDRNLNSEYIIKYSENLDNDIKNILMKIDNSSKILLSIFKSTKLNKWWINKSNLFTLSIIFYKNSEKIALVPKDEIIIKLNNFMLSDGFAEYKSLCQNSVNDKQVRINRDSILNKVLF